MQAEGPASQRHPAPPGSLEAFGQRPGEIVLPVIHVRDEPRGDPGLELVFRRSGRRGKDRHPHRRGRALHPGGEGRPFYIELHAVVPRGQGRMEGPEGQRGVALRNVAQNRSFQIRSGQTVHQGGSGRPSGEKGDQLASAQGQGARARVFDVRVPQVETIVEELQHRYPFGLVRGAERLAETGFPAVDRRRGLPQ